ncbi:hypothetical protein SADUNF_Sadunf16G0220300 [Salix dunnii]|uniref:Protein kinase domain-containing protein n=1 Tax=Salix dunnii TaxID=1413687 RepID=A0A835MJQ1_9ROSI|nr:hypothetical protein SADUNF_Sadunf16G0220300 [Salix dunnii]
MGSSNGFYSGEFNLDAKWLVDPKLLFVGPKIGEGAHAKVYEGKYKNQNVAIKIVHGGETPEEIAKRQARFAREVAMLSRVQHKNLVKFIGACKEPVMVIVTELLLGGTLRKYLLNMRPRCLEMRVAVGFALDIARAMECLHSHGIIHRDLKPENLILTADHKTVKLADFGLAREESLTEMMTAETGTYRWMAPELYSTVTLRHGEKKHYNHKVDAYSFAIVLWELIHNKLPFEGMSNLQAAYAAAFKCPFEIICEIACLNAAELDCITLCHIEFARVLDHKNVRPSAENLPEDLALIVTSCWKEDPNARPNFNQIIQMLLHYLSTISAQEPVIPARIFTSENAVLPPESPGTSSLMAVSGVGVTVMIYHYCKIRSVQRPLLLLLIKNIDDCVRVDHICMDLRMLDSMLGDKDLNEMSIISHFQKQDPPVTDGSLLLSVFKLMELHLFATG